MAIKLADTLAPMADFPAVEAKDVAFNDNKSLQEKLDNGDLGGSTSVDISAEADNAIETKEDGIYVSKMKLSTDTGNALTEKSDGLFVEDKAGEIEAINKKVESIRKYKKYVNTDLDYCYLTVSSAFSGVKISTGDIVGYDNMKECNNMDYDLSNHTITLKQGKTYRITCNLYHLRGALLYGLWDITNNILLRSFYNAAANSTTEASSLGCICVYTPESDCQIQVKVSSASDSDSSYTSLSNDYGYFIVEEINHKIVVDPLDYVNESQGIEDTPVGHIIPYMGKTAPKHYLICDGAEYNITEYPYLTQHFIDEFDSVNYFGGDGITTFAVPDLRGEFLRGTGTAARNTGSGGNVGEHQNGSNIQNPIATNTANTLMYIPKPKHPQFISTSMLVPDKIISTETNNGSYRITEELSSQKATMITSYSVRPTNTSVLYCIKYEPTYFMKNIYSADSVNYTDEEIQEAVAAVLGGTE